MGFTLNAQMFDFLVLAITAKQDTYGYEISQTLKTVSNTKDSSLYPILKKLQEKGYLKTYDGQYQGRNRRYYTITASGKNQYDFLLKEWADYTQAIDSIITGGITNEQN